MSCHPTVLDYLKRQSEIENRIIEQYIKSWLRETESTIDTSQLCIQRTGNEIKYWLEKKENFFVSEEEHERLIDEA